MKKAILCGAAMVCGALTAGVGMAQNVGAPAPGGVSTLAQAVAAAIDSQPEVRASWEAFLAAGDDRRVARAGYLPTVGVNGEIGGASRDYDKRGWFTRDHLEVSVSQMLFDGFLTRSQVEEASQARLARYYELLDAVQTKALEAAIAYEDVRQYRATVALAEQNLAAHAGIRDLIRERTDSGVGAEADLQQTDGRYALAEANLLTEQANLHDVTARFLRIVGDMPAASLAEIEAVAGYMPGAFQAVMDEAVRRHPTLFAANATAEAARAEVSEARSAFYPKVNLGARAGTYRNTSSFNDALDPRARGEEVFVGVNVNYNLFRGGADTARVSAAERRVGQSRELVNKACVDLRQTASIAWNDVESLRSRIDALREHRDGAANVVNSYDQQFRIGRRTLLDVLDSRNEAFQAERALVQANHELNKAQYRTLYSMGVLLDVLGQQRAGLPPVSELDPAGRQPDVIDCRAAFAFAG